MEKISFAKLPTVLASQELIDTAFKRASRAATKIGGRPREVAIQRERRRIVVMTTAVSEQITKSVAGFPSVMELPPFYRDLIDAIVGVDRLRKSLGAVNGLVAAVNKVRRETLRKLRFASSPAEAAAARREAYGRISSILKKADENLYFLKQVAQKLSGLPSVYVDAPTVVIAGYPNVGKSTLLRALTGSSPKIAPYPFTTTGLQLGYFEHRRRRYQVVDTPGLLDRPLERRNAIERQAIAALRHLAKVVLFLLDPSETCGYELTSQLHLLNDIENAFKGTRVIVVANKSDLLTEDKTRRLGERRRDISYVTATTGQGVEELREILTT